MTSASTTASTAGPFLPARRVYLAAFICLLAGLVIGYMLRGLEPTTPPVQQTAAGARGAAAQGGTQRMPTLAEMKHMADKQAEPLLQKLKSDPNNGQLLAQLGSIYHSTHQFTQAVDYYGRAVKAEPKNVNYRTKLATSLYRSGDADKAIAELNDVLKIKPNDANALFNLGIIELHGKSNAKGAISAWQKLLKTNPQLDAQRKAEVQQFITQVRKVAGSSSGTQGAGSVK